MAALNIKPIVVGGVGGNLLSNIPATAEKNKQWQRELLMERIRSHSSQHKTFPELSKGMRMGMLEKRYPLDAVEKSNLQKCLDNMQHCIKVTSRRGLVERLESLSRQLSLKFSDDSKALFISTDMFYLEILLDSNGSLTDVKVHHESKVEQQSCSELVDCLNRGDFADFTAQLEGFSSIYQLNAESKVKIKAYDAMQAMETDLYNIFQMQNFSKDAAQVLQDSAVGIVMQRRGGHPMRLVYFVSPYDLISLETKSLQPIALDTFSNKQVGFSVTVNLEASSANKLQILPTVTFSKDPQTGMDVPVFAPLTQMNSMLLPATFVLRLNKPLPVCYNTLRSMGLCSAASNDSNPLPTSSSAMESQNKPPVIANIMSLIIQTASEQQTKSSQKGLFVCLPDQTHCYFFTENKLMKSTLIHSVPFTEPSHVRKILEFLKKMALFYSLLASCVRPQSKMGIDMDSTTVLEVNAISFQQISVGLQHPYEESMATVEFDLRSGVPQCSIYSISKNYDLLSIKLTSIVQKCLSIPVTIRALLKFWDQERMKMFQRSMGATSAAGAGGGGGGPNAATGGAGVGGMGSSHGSYGNFNITGGPNDPGGGMGGVRMGGGGLSGGVGIKMECSTGGGGIGGGQQRALLPQMPAGGPAGFLKYKSGDLKQEDFHESPKSQTTTSAAAADSVTASNLMQSNLEVNSLGHQQQQQTQQQQQQQQLLEQQIADHEIADKYKNIWKDKTTNLKNTVSITPISSEGSTSSPLDVKRTGGIEIIPLTGRETNNPPTNLSNAPSPMNNSGSTTITITPINAGSASNASKEKKLSSNSMGSSGTATSSSSSSTSSSSNKRSLESSDGQKDKKRKKRRDDSPMGPPEKIFSRQNSPAGSSEAAATAVARKFSSPSSSPKGSSGGLLASSVSGSSLSARPSPKHSPVYSSPKHNTASNSPKSPFGTHSPKHGSSGKPSMSTLKSATAASPKGDKSSSSSSSTVSSSNVLSTAALVRSLTGAGSSSSATTASTVAAAAAAAALAALKNKDKTTSMSSAAAAAAAAAVKSSMGVTTSMQQMKSVPGLNLMSAAASNFAGGSNSSNSALDLNSAMRKGVAAAVSLMTSTPTTATISKSQTLHQALPTAPAALGLPDRVKQPRPPPPAPMSHPGTSEERGVKAKASSVSQTHSTSSGSSGASSNSEYMVKSSQEGLKLTINKTSTTTSKASSSSSYSSSSSSSSSSKFSTKSSTQRLGSPSSHSSSTGSSKKAHTGLKPGVTSGPASKKPASSSPSSSSSSSGTSRSSSSASKHAFQKSNSSGSLSTKLGSGSNSYGSSSSSSGLGLSKSHSTNSFGDYRRSSKKSHSASTSPALQTPYSSSSSHSQPASRLDHQADMMKILQYASPTMAASMEGFMKGLNSKFQIPKLSQRNNTNTNISSSSSLATMATTANTNTAGATATASLSSTPAASQISAIKPNDKKSSSSSYSLSPAQQQYQHPQHTQSSTSVHILKSPSTTAIPINTTPSSNTTSSASSSSSASLSASNSTTAKSTSLDFINTTKSSTNPTHVADDTSLLAAAGTAPPPLTGK